MTSHTIPNPVFPMRVPRPDEGQALFMFESPDGKYRRLCHTFPKTLTCWVDLPGTWRGESSIYQGGQA